SDRFHYPEAQTALVRFANNVRSVRSFWPRAEATLARHAINNLTILKISSTGSVPAFVDLFSHSHNLRLLDMTCLLQDATVVERFLSVLRNHRRLQELRMRLFNTPMPITRRILLSCGNLYKILIKVSMGIDENPKPAHDAIHAELVELAGSGSPSFKVRDLEINSGIQLGDPLFLLLGLCPNIERFTAPSSYFWSQTLTDTVTDVVAELASRMRSTMTKLRHLDMGMSDMHESTRAILSRLAQDSSAMLVFMTRGSRKSPSAPYRAITETPSLLSICVPAVSSGQQQEYSSPFSAPARICKVSRPWDPSTHVKLTHTKSTLCQMNSAKKKGSIHSKDSQVEYIPESLIEELGCQTKLQELWLGRVTRVPEGAEYTFWDMTKEQLETGREQVSQLLATLSTLPWIRRLEFQGLLEAMVDADVT
ncbi:hypothetical protein BGZ52_006624, partial [Haplosporangium bisporale]